jgi:tetratricopeptide (TPR) repeat protein
MLGFVYLDAGDAVKAEETLKKQVAVAPGEANPLDSLAFMYYLTGRLDEAVEYYKQALKVKPDFGCEEIIGYIEAVKGNTGGALAWIDQFILMASNNDNKGRGYWWKAVYNHVSGRRGQAKDEMKRFHRFAESVGSKYGVALALSGEAWLFFDSGDYDNALRCHSQGQQVIDDMFNESVARPLEALHAFKRDLMAGFAAVREGGLEAARGKVDAATTAWPGSRGFRLGQDRVLELALISLRADVLVLEGKPAEAIALMEKEFKLTISGFGPPVFPYNYYFLNFPLDQDVIPRAHEKMGNIDKAIEAYKKLLTFDPKSQDRRLHVPIYHYRLAKLYDASGLKDQARGEYQKLVEDWKDGDPGIPELVDAKKRVGASH